MGKKDAVKLDATFEALTDVLNRVRSLESKGLCNAYSSVSCKLPNGVSVTLAPQSVKDSRASEAIEAARETNAVLQQIVATSPEYEALRRRASERQQTAEDSLRGSGRTTSCILQAIATALDTPDTWVRFVDHVERSTTYADLANTSDEITCVVEALGLQLDVMIALAAPGVYLRSNLQELQRKRELAAERFREVFGTDPPDGMEMVESEFGPLFCVIGATPQLPAGDEIQDYGSGELFPSPSNSSGATEAGSPESPGSLSESRGTSP